VRARLSKELENEREVGKRLKDRIQTLVQEKKELRAEVQTLQLEGDAKESAARNELEQVNQYSLYELLVYAALSS
jgi:cell division protein FtsB